MTGRGVAEAPTRWALSVVASAQFVLLLDLTILNVALPTIQDELRLGEARLHWLVTAYALTFGSFLLLAGRAADVLGRLRVFVAGLLLFGLASLLAGFAADGAMLVAARAGQGLGAAAVSSAALALVATNFAEGAERNRALGVFAAVASAGGVSGLILGGPVTEWMGWRWVFLVNVPLVVVAALAAPLTLRDRRSAGTRPLDLVGAGLGTLALLALVYGFARGGHTGFDDLTSRAGVAAALALGAAFVVTERRAVDPLVPPRLLRIPGLLGVHLTSFAASALITTTPFVLTLYMQRVLDMSPSATGLAFLPMTMTIMVTSTVAARLAARTGVQRLLQIGAGTLALSALVLSRVSAEGGYLTDVLPGMLLFALGLGICYTAASIGGTAGVPDADQGVAGGLLNTFKQVGGAVGLAVLALSPVDGDDGTTARGMQALLVEEVQGAFVAGLGFAVLAALAATTLTRPATVGHGRPAFRRQDRVVGTPTGQPAGLRAEGVCLSARR